VLEAQLIHVSLARKSRRQAGWLTGKEEVIGELRGVPVDEDAADIVDRYEYSPTDLASLCPQDVEDLIVRRSAWDCHAIAVIPRRGSWRMALLADSIYRDAEPSSASGYPQRAMVEDAPTQPEDQNWRLRVDLLEIGRSASCHHLRILHGDRRTVLDRLIWGPACGA
jgi:hypothetical protein